MARGVRAHNGGGYAGDAGLAAWKLPLIVAAIAVSIVAGFYVGGPGLGMAVGGLAAGSIVVLAVRHPPLYPIAPARAWGRRCCLLLVVTEPLEDSDAIGRIVDAARAGEPGEPDPEILVLAPARHRFLDRWASDYDRGRERAQRTLVLSLASLARAELTATAQVGDEDPVRAVEDQLRSYPASAVILATGESSQDAAGHEAATELATRLQVPFHHLANADPGSSASSASPRGS